MSPRLPQQPVPQHDGPHDMAAPISSPRPLKWCLQRVFQSLTRVLVVAATAAILIAVPGTRPVADTITLNPDHPERYVVREGDTLWGIAGRFLRDPWQWPALWHVNEQIENPHLIYPGDVLVLTWDAGDPQVRVLRSERITRLSPEVREELVREPITTIPPSAIQPFLTAPIVLDPNRLSEHPYITTGEDGRIAYGKYSRVYARQMPEAGELSYQIYRPGRDLIDPDTSENLGIHGIYLGEARLLARGDPAQLEIVRSTEEVLPADRLLPMPRTIALPTYMPRAPGHEVRGRILLIENGVTEAGPYSIVALSLGTRNGIEEGHVLRILRDQGQHRDPVSGELYDLPNEPTGLLMVFRSFEKASFALIMRATRPIQVLDFVTTP